MARCSGKEPEQDRPSSKGVDFPSDAIVRAGGRCAGRDHCDQFRPGYSLSAGAIRVIKRLPFPFRK
jgi:hypothetical protein